MELTISRPVQATLLLAAITAVGWSQPSSAEEKLNARIRIERGSSARVLGLSFPDDYARVRFIRKNEKTHAAVLIRAQFVRKDWSVLVNNKPIQVRAGAVQFRSWLTGERTPVKISTVGPRGELHEEVIFLVYEGQRPEFDKSGKKDEARKSAYDYDISFGPTLIQYSETDRKDFSSLALTVKGGGRYSLLAGRVDIGLSTFINPVNLTQSTPGVNARFLGLNFRVGYYPSILPAPWRFGVLVGIYYLSMSVSVPQGEQLFGFSGVMGPQLFPVVTRNLRGGGSIGGYLKFSPIGTGFSLRNLSDREIGAGVQWRRSLDSEIPFILAVDFSDLALNFEEVSTRISARTFSCSIGVQF